MRRAIIISAAVAVLAGCTIDSTDNEPSRSNIQWAWESLSVSDRAELCDGYRQLGYAVTYGIVLDNTETRSEADQFMGVIVANC